MSRFSLILFVTLLLPSYMEAQVVSERWSYPYGDGRVSLIQDTSLIAVKMIDGLEDELASLQTELRSIRGVAKIGERDRQEYPGLWYIPVTRGIRPEMFQRALDMLAAATVVEFAGPVFQYREAVMIPRPEVIITFDGSVDDEQIRSVISNAGLRFLKEFSAIDPTVLVSFQGPTSRGFEISDALVELEEVAVAEPNFIHDLPEMATPNDPLFSNQWDMLNTGQTGGTIGADMKAAAAWDISTGSSTIVVAVIDEGVDVDHPDLAANMVAGHDAVTADPTPEGVPGNANSTDGHGTCCAGIIAAVGNNGIGVSGVTWNSKIMPIRIGFGNFWTQTDWIIDGLTWPVDNGADILSNSWGGGSASTAIQNAVVYGTTNGRGGLGSPVFFASGNDNSTVSYPAAYPEAIAVGASSPCDERKSPSSCDGETWWGSNFGSTLDFVAPGPLTTTVDIAGSGGYSSTDYTSSFNGTSSATPHAAGAGALLLAVAPGLTHAEVRTLMRQTADDQVGPPSEDTAGFDNFMGYGRINCESMLLAVASSVAGPTSFTCNASAADAVLSWVNGDSYSQIEVSRGGSTIATLGGTATSYTDTSAGVGNISYSIRGFQGADQSPSASCSVFLTGGATDLVWAPSAAAGTVSGGSAISAALTANGRTPLVVTTLDSVESLDAFETIWVNLGIYPSNHVLSATEGSILDGYLTNGVGGEFLYMEGGDTWAYDTATAVHARFGISGLSDGTGDLSTINGAAAAGCDLAGNSWSYGGENNWIDHLGTSGASVATLTNPSPAYNVGIFNDSGSYRTFGTSFEIGGISNGAATQSSMVAAILNCFVGSSPPPPAAPVADFSATPTSGEAPVVVSFSDGSTGDVTSYAWNFGDGGSSTAQNPSHTYTSAGSYTVTLTVTGPGGSDSATCGGCITVTDPPPPPPASELLYISFVSTTTVPGLGTVRDEDIVTYDTSTGVWDWYLDGSDVGIGGTDINALSVRADGSVLVSFNSGSFSVPGLTGGPSGTTVEDSDLVLFTPTTTGSSSAGTWSFYLDGSDCALTTNGEDIDGVCYLDDGTLLMSTLGTARGGGPTNRDEDVMLFTPTSIGSASGGSWTTFFDGSDVGFSNSGGEDLNAISLDFDGSLLFSTQGTYSASGSTGDDEDISRFTGTFGSGTSGVAQLILDLSALGINASEDIDGLSIR
ncbi:MAG: S8 family serine peptidase [Planctomycetota bacterium]